MVMNEKLLKELCLTLAKSKNDGTISLLKKFILKNKNLISDKKAFTYEIVYNLMLNSNFDVNLERFDYICDLYDIISDKFNNIIYKFAKEEINNQAIIKLLDSKLGDLIKDYLLGNLLDFSNNKELTEYIINFKNFNPENTVQNILIHLKALNELCSEIPDKVYIGEDNILKKIIPPKKEVYLERINNLTYLLSKVLDRHIKNIKIDNNLVIEIIDNVNGDITNDILTTFIKDDLLNRDTINKCELFNSKLRVNYNNFIRLLLSSNLTCEEMQKINSFDIYLNNLFNLCDDEYKNELKKYMETKDIKTKKLTK